MGPKLLSVSHQPVARMFNRELSLIAFHERVLALAADPTLPLLERLRFLCISCTNLDEFFEIRVARLRHAIKLGASGAPYDGMSPSETLEAVHRRARRLVDAQYECWREDLLPALAAEGIRFAGRRSWDAALKDWLREHFRTSILPVLSPFGLDPARPFPHIINKSLNFVVGIEGEDALQRRSHYAVVQAPRSLPRLIQLPPELGYGRHTFVLLASLIRAFAEDVFPGMRISACHQFRVTRNSDLFLDGEDFDDLLLALSDRLVERQHAAAVRVEVSKRCAPEYLQLLSQQFELDTQDFYFVDGPVNLNRLLALYDMVDRPDLKYPRMRPGGSEAIDLMFERLRDADLLVHHPYESFAPVIAFLSESARDPQVLAIKQTLYRTGPESAVVDALVTAAHAGKEVTVVIELRARFDEADNIRLANRLQEAGAHVVYGVVGFKTHAKMILVVRREGEVLRRYVHLGTGNYHPSTAKSYTDYGLFTADEKICADVHAIFLQLTGLSARPQLQRLWMSPFDLHSKLLEKIAAESEHARAGRAGRIVARVNSLVEPEIIDALYAASAAGVEIELVVRGMCCLRPQVPGLSEHIRVRSILGRFLEHARVYYFANGGAHDVYLSSADWMDRNFFRRVEVCVPLQDDVIKRRVMEELELYSRDEAGAWELGEDGVYRRITAGEGEHEPSVQRELLRRYERGSGAAAESLG